MENKTKISKATSKILIQEQDYYGSVTVGLAVVVLNRVVIAHKKTGYKDDAGLKMA